MISQNEKYADFFKNSRSDLQYSNGALRRRYKAKCPKQPKIINLSCSKTNNDNEMENLIGTYLTYLAILNSCTKQR